MLRNEDGADNIYLSEDSIQSPEDSTDRDAIGHSILHHGGFQLFLKLVHIGR